MQSAAMARPRPKESPSPGAPPRAPRRRMPPPGAETLARARELERELGRPLRAEIDGPLNDREWEEVLLARLVAGGETAPAGELLKEFGRR